MKIGIITHPLRTNYGGILQNFALQKVLCRLGYEAYTIGRNGTPAIYSACIFSRFIFYLKQVVKKLLKKAYAPSFKEYKKINEFCTNFIEENITTTGTFNNNRELQKIIEKYNFEGYVVGSDQVWRPSYTHNIYNNFLDFCQEKKDVKRIAYAASFGVDNWEYNDGQTKECSRLAKLFNAISVREESGITLCKDHLKTDATLVLDPTLLLEKEDYVKLVTKAKKRPSKGDIFCYILDNDTKISDAIQNIEKKMSMKCFQVKSSKPPYSIKYDDKINEHIIPAPTEWLRAYMDAKIVFTDSFHGCVFSIIFNKPFWVVGNKKRGNARFDSLLKLFNLESRRIDLDNIMDIDIMEPIEWDRVNTIKEVWKNKSLTFIKDNL